MTLDSDQEHPPEDQQDQHPDQQQDQQILTLPTLPDYEMRLLTAMAFFLGRKVNQQAAAVVAMYLRQSHDRILTQTEYYAHRLGISKWDLLELISTNPEQAQALLTQAGKVHDDDPDIFTWEYVLKVSRKFLAVASTRTKIWGARMRLPWF